MKKMLFLSFIAFGLAIFISCGDDEEATTGTITGTVYYDGTNTGNVGIAAFTSLPPMEAPAGMRMITDPEFPQVYEISNLDPGTYYLFASMDVGGDNPTTPDYAEDPVSNFSSAINITAGETVSGVDLTLVDP